MPAAASGLIGILAGGFIGGFIAEKTLSPEKLNSTEPSHKTENEFRRFFYIIAGAVTGGFVFTAPYLLKWTMALKGPHIPERRAQPIPEREAQCIPERAPQNIPQRHAQQIPDRQAECIPERLAQRIPQREAQNIRQRNAYNSNQQNQLRLQEEAQLRKKFRSVFAEETIAELNPQELARYYQIYDQVRAKNNVYPCVSVDRNEALRLLEVELQNEIAQRFNQ